jgi:predicted ATP-binding protein involved in virulence
MEMLSKLTKNKVELFKYRESDLEIKYTNKDTREKVSNLSDGYKNMIGMVSDIAYRMAILNPNLGVDVTKYTSGVVLIDELDLHLHPKWQKKIVDILLELFPKVQFIATSHSPFIIQSMNENSIIKLGKYNSILSIDATLLSIDDIAEDIQNIELPQVSKRKSDMLEVADKYFDLLERLGNSTATKEEVESYKIKLDELLEPFEDNMAYVALLRRKRLITESKL